MLKSNKPCNVMIDQNSPITLITCETKLRQQQKERRFLQYDPQFKVLENY